MERVRDYIRASSLALLSLDGDKLSDFDETLGSADASAVFSKFMTADLNAIFVEASGGGAFANFVFPYAFIS